MLKIITAVVINIATSEGPARIHHSKNSEAAIHTQQCSLKYNHALKSHPYVKVNINYRLLFCVSTIGVCISFDFSHVRCKRNWPR